MGCTPLFLGGDHGEAENKVALACPCPVSPVEVSLSLSEDVEIIHYPAIPSCTAMILRVRENTEDCQPPCSEMNGANSPEACWGEGAEVTARGNRARQIKYTYWPIASPKRQFSFILKCSVSAARQSSSNSSSVTNKLCDLRQWHTFSGPPFPHQ